MVYGAPAALVKWQNPREKQACAESRGVFFGETQSWLSFKVCAKRGNMLARGAHTFMRHRCAFGARNVASLGSWVAEGPGTQNRVAHPIGTVAWFGVGLLFGWISRFRSRGSLVPDIADRTLPSPCVQGHPKRQNLLTPKVSNRVGARAVVVSRCRSVDESRRIRCHNVWTLLDLFPMTHTIPRTLKPESQPCQRQPS
jgi:hypothetical protein